MSSKPMIAVGILATVFSASGCLITSNNKVEESGIRISRRTMDQVEPGVTSEAWLIATLGEPSARTPVGDQPGLEILRYDYERVEASSGTVLFVFAGSSHDRIARRAFFEVQDGIIIRHWLER